MRRSPDFVLSLGSNSGDRRAHLRAGLECLLKSGFSIEKISPTVESPAQLPPRSPSEWNRPFLNLVVMGTSVKDIDTFRREIKAIQHQFDKLEGSKWSPRELDIDIVAWGRSMPSGTPQTECDWSICTRPYVLSPLLHIAPSWPVTERGERTALQLSSANDFELHIPIWMGILNITPDSFSDGGRFRNLEEVRLEVEKMIRGGVNIIDVGAESTRPHATALEEDEEWRRLAPVLDLVTEVCANTPLPPEISVDTYHSSTAEKALNSGVDMINDVSGLRHDGMLALARESGKTFIAMHSVTIPVNPKISIDQREDACQLFEVWINERRQLWEASGLDLDRVVVDPGIGFGKSSLQSLALMRSVQRFRRLGQRVLIGHSRKRFLRAYSKYEGSQLDLETIGASLNLCAQSVDILRVHNVEDHTRAYLSWAHLLSNRNDA